MVTKNIKKLAAARARLEALQRSVANEVKRELSGLPAEYGYSDVNEFIRAVREAAGGGGRGAKRGPGRPPGSGGRTGAGRRRRAVITEETRALVKQLHSEGKTGAEIAKAASISLPSVQNVKKALGLVKARK